MLAVRDLEVRFKGLRALQGISFDVQEGEILGVIGPNGAGKTTLFNAITGFVRPAKGNVNFRGRRLNGLSPERICRFGIARTFQIARPFAALSVLDNVVVGALARHPRVADARQHAYEVLRVIGLEQFSQQLARGLPVGLRKRLELARAVATGCDLLFMDEVMGGLNPSEVQEALRVVRVLQSYGLTIVLIEHNMGALMSLVDRVIALSFGQLLASGTPTEITHNPDVIAAYLGKSHGVT